MKRERRSGGRRVAGFRIAVVLAAAVLPLAAQTTPAPQKPGAVSSADGKVVGVDTPVNGAPPQSREQLTQQAWQMLTDAVRDEKHTDLQIQALAALGTLGSNARANALIGDAFGARDVDVRTAAALAAGQTRSHALVGFLHRALDDNEAQVAFAAASALWKMGDRAGEDILIAVVDGERKASAPLMQGSMHQANRELHNPAALARLGAETGASLLLGPFGFGVTAYEYIRKNGGDSARVRAVEEIATSHTPAVRVALQGALVDKDAGVRAAAARAMRIYHDEQAQRALAQLFTDSKKPVQFSAAAAYLVSSGAVATPRPETPPAP